MGGGTGRSAVPAAEERAAPPLLTIGGSAGSIEPLQRLLRALDPTLDAAVLVTGHVGDRLTDRLAQVLGRSSRWPVSEAVDGQPLEPGRVLLAPGGRHLLAAGHRVVLSSGPKVNRHRPSVDVMMVAAARSAG